MKFLCIILLLFIASVSNAQESQLVTEGSKSFSKGNYNGYSVVIPRAKLKEVAKDWNRYLRRNKGRVNENDDEYTLSKIVVAEVSKDSIIIYSNLKAIETDVLLTGAATKNDSDFFSTSSNPETSETFKSFLRNFAVNEYRNIVTDELADEQKRLKRIENELKDLEGDNEQSEKKIKSNKRDIERIEDDIRSNQQLKEIKSDAIIQQQKVIATYLTSSDLKKEEEKKLKAMQKEKSKIDKDDESMHRKIESREDENKDLEKRIDHNKNDMIPAKKEEIEKQNKVILGVDTKLKGIR